MTTNTFGLLPFAPPPKAVPTSGTQNEHALHNMYVERIPAKLARAVVVANHYLDRRPAVSYAYGLYANGELAGVVTFGIPASRHLQMSACRGNPNQVIELNRLWLSDDLPKNTASWFVARAMKEMPPLIVVSYADTAYGHDGTVYRAMSWNWAGWTDMSRKSPRNDYIPVTGGHSRDSSRFGWTVKVPRSPKFRYWTTTGTPAQRRALAKQVTWPSMNWATVQNKPAVKAKELAVAA